MALAQQTFDVASVKPSAPQEGGRGALAMMMERMSDSQPRGWLPAEKGRLRLENRSLRSLIAAAYGARSSEVSGPAWMADARFEVQATFPEGTKKEALTEMLRNLLAERFGLVVHREDKEVPGYALTEAKGGAKLTSAAPEKPVLDETGIDGKFAVEIVLERYGDDTQEYAAQQALAKLGLKLEARKVTVSTVVVDKVERTPKEN